MPDQLPLDETLEDQSTAVAEAPPRMSRSGRTPSRNGRATPELDKKALLDALSAFRRGDFAVRLPTNWKGVDGKIADAFNGVVELNESMAYELQRIAKVVGRDGKTDERAEVGRLKGGWADWVDSVNALISDLAWPINEMA